MPPSCSAVLRFKCHRRCNTIPSELVMNSAQDSLSRIPRPCELKMRQENSSIQLKVTDFKYRGLPYLCSRSPLALDTLTDRLRCDSQVGKTVRFRNFN
ncbi:hypothetical protein XELAEV_18005066mg [Xenopus laevis]|uniref:Uncharacterized protein n=1 Tax=Xenopus laevis TaxID=8355 RepID=A0A974DW58_XENLA|nr:hypothetical protein XELAEV_18005066mg [Xenopus laevis]